MDRYLISFRLKVLFCLFLIRNKGDKLLFSKKQENICIGNAIENRDRKIHGGNCINVRHFSYVKCHPGHHFFEWDCIIYLFEFLVLLQTWVFFNNNSCK